MWAMTENSNPSYQNYLITDDGVVSHSPPFHSKGHGHCEVFWAVSRADHFYVLMGLVGQCDCTSEINETDVQTSIWTSLMCVHVMSHCRLVPNVGVNFLVVPASCCCSDDFLLWSITCSYTRFIFHVLFQHCFIKGTHHPFTFYHSATQFVFCLLPQSGSNT